MPWSLAPFAGWLLIAFGLVLGTGAIARRAFRRTGCMACGYDRRASASAGPCPECGRDVASARRIARRRTWTMAAVGTVAVILGCAIGPGRALAHRSVALLPDAALIRLHGWATGPGPSGDSGFGGFGGGGFGGGGFGGRTNSTLVETIDDELESRLRSGSLSLSAAADLARRWLAAVDESNRAVEVSSVWPSEEPLRISLLLGDSLRVRTDAIVALRTLDGVTLASHRVAPPRAIEIRGSLPGIWEERLDDPTIAVPASAIVDGRIRLEVVVAESAVDRSAHEPPVLSGSSGWLPSPSLDEEHILARRVIDEPLPVKRALEECVEIRRDDALASIVRGSIRAAFERDDSDLDRSLYLVLEIDATLLPSICLACSVRLTWAGGEAPLRDLFLHHAKYSLGGDDPWAVLTVLELPPHFAEVLTQEDASACRLVLRGEPRLAIRDSSCRAAWDGEVSIPIAAQR